MKTVLQSYVLEKNTAAFIQAIKSSGSPPLYQLSPGAARDVLEQLQSQIVAIPEITIIDKTIAAGPKGKLSIHIFRPKNVATKLPIVMYFHGGGWILGSLKTHKRLCSEIALQSNVAVVFVNYSLSPEAKFPIAIEEAYAATQYVYQEADKLNLDPKHLMVAGDSVGGNMALAVSLLTQERKGAAIEAQILLYPVTSSQHDCRSYQQFADGPWLTKSAMQWFWNAYEPTIAARENPLISPLNATIEQLSKMPPTLIITAENDVLRDEGEALAHKLMEAGVAVSATRLLGTIHDFAMLNALSNTPAARTALILIKNFITK